MEFHALAVADSTLFAFGSPGALHKSTDNGSTWIIVKWRMPMDYTGFCLGILDGMPVGGTSKGCFLKKNMWSWYRQAVEGLDDDIRAVGSTTRDTISTWYLGGDGGGVRRSTDQGQTWTTCNDGLTDLHVTSFATIPAPGDSGQTLFAGTLGGGIFRATDDGSHWTVSNAGLGPLHVHALAAHGDTLFAAQSTGRISRSSDAGSSWIQLGTGLPSTDIISLASVPLSGGRSLYAGTIDAGIWRYDPARTVWEPLNTGLKSLRINAIIARDTILFVATDRGIYRSFDRGSLWHLTSDGATPLVSSLYAASFSSGGPTTRLFTVSNEHYSLKEAYSHGTGAGDLCSAVSWTDDLGRTWTTTPATPNFISRSFRFEYFAAQHDDNILLFTTGKGDHDKFRYHLSTDRGTTWSDEVEPRADFTRTTLSGVTFRRQPDGPGFQMYITFAYGPCWGMHRSLDSGRTWSTITLPANGKIFDPLMGMDSVMYAASLTSALRSSDDGQTWDPFTYNGTYPYYTPPGSISPVPGFKLLHTSNRRLFAHVVPAIIPGDPGGLYASTDHGTTWTPAGFTGLSVDRIIESDSVLFALQNGHVFASRPDPLSWKDVSGELTTDSIVVITASPEYLVALTEASDRIWYRPMTEIKAILDDTPVHVPVSAPVAFALLQNYPNPFNPTTTIGYQIPVSGHVKLAVFDLLGREVAVLVDERKTAGRYEVRFDGAGLSSGVYFYRIRVHHPESVPSGRSGNGDVMETRTLILLR